MLEKAETAGDLAKGLVSHFHKAAEHHAAMHKAHAEHAGFLKGKHDALDDGHEMKAYVKAQADHHTAMADMHKAYGEHCMKLADEEGATKAVKATETKELSKTEEKKDPTTVATDAVSGAVDKAMEAVMAKVLETISTSGKVEKMVEDVVLAKVNEKLGNKTVPDGVRGVFPQTPPEGLLIPRSGETVNTTSVDPMMKMLVEPN